MRIWTVRLSKSGYEALPYWKVGSVDSSVQANCQTSLATGNDVAIHIGVINQLKNSDVTIDLYQTLKKPHNL